MSGPWEKYKQQPTTAEGPWAKYGAKPAAPPKEEETTWGEFAQGVGTDLLSGIQSAARGTLTGAAKLALSGADTLIPGDLTGTLTRDANAFFGRGIEATDAMAPDAYQREKNKQIVSRDENGNLVFAAPTGEQVAGTVARMIPELPGLLVGGGAAKKVLQEGSKKLATRDGLSTALGYGAANAQQVSQAQYADTYAEVLNQEIEKGTPESEARARADEAATKAEAATAALSFVTGAAGLGAAARLGGKAATRLGGAAKGFVSDAPFEGVEEAGQTAIGDWAAGREFSPERTASAGLLGAFVGGVPGAAVGAANIKLPEPPKNITKPEPAKMVLPDTGVPAFDAGKAIAARMMEGNLNEGPKQDEMFGRTPSVPSAQDMFSGELRAVPDATIPADPDAPVRSEQRQAALESDYIFQQQERLKEEVKRRMEARQPAKADVAETGVSEIVKEMANQGRSPTMAAAFEEAGLRRRTGLLQKEGGFEAEQFFPDTRPTPETEGPSLFEPSRVPTVDRPVEQPSLDLEAQRPLGEVLAGAQQPSLFDQPPEVPKAPQSAPSAPQAAPAASKPQAPAAPNDFASILATKNRESMEKTGSPLTPDQVDTLRRVNAAKTAGTPVDAQATSPVDRMEMIDFEDEGEVNSEIRSRMSEDAGVRTALDAEIAKGPNGKIENVLLAVANAKGANEYQKSLAIKLAAVTRQLGIKLVAPDIDPVTGEKGWAGMDKVGENVQGAYSAVDNAIRFKSANPEVMLHEVAHGISKAILNDPEIQAKNPEVKKAVDDLKGLLAEVTLETAKRSDLIDQYPTLKAELTRYGTKNIDEFFTMAMTNPEFQKFLASIKSDNKSPKTLWQKFKDVLKRLLGLGRLEGSALDRAIDRTFEIAEFAGRNPQQVREATARVGERIKKKVVEQRAKKQPDGEALVDEMALPQQKKEREIPTDRGITGPLKMLSAQWGRMFGKDFEKTSAEILAAKESAQRVYTSLSGAGYSKLKSEDQARVDLAMNGKADITDLSPKMQAAVKDYRNRVMMEQLRLAYETNDADTAKMIYDSIARGDYSTRAYAAFDLRPDAVDAFLYAAHRLVHGSEKPYWLWKQEKESPSVVKALEKYISDNLIIRDLDSMDDKAKAKIASFYGFKGTEEEIDALLKKERARLGAFEEAQVTTLMRRLADPLSRDNADVRLQKQAARDMTILMKRSDVPKELREFWGEFTQAPLKGAMTISRLGKLVAQTRLLNSLAIEGRGNYLFAEGDVAKPGFDVPLPNTEAMGPLGGMFTRKDIAKQLETLVDTSTGHSDAEWQQAGQAVWQMWSKVMGTTKLMATVLNAPTAIANLVSSMAAMPNFYTRAALMGQPVKGLQESMGAFKNALFDAFGLLKEDVAKNLIAAGVLREGVQLGELNDMLQEFEWEAQSKKGKLPARMVRGGQRAVKRAVQQVGAMYQISDNMLRLQAAAIEFNIQKVIHPELTDAEAMEIAADRAKNNVPTWSRASPAVRKAGTLMGSFPTFVAEVFRTTAHQILYAAKDFEQGRKSGNKKQMAYGAVQLVTTVGQMAFMKAVLPLVLASFLGLEPDEREENNAALANLVPEFHRGNSVELMHVDQKGMRAVYSNTDRMDLMGPIWTVIGKLRQTDPEFSDIADTTLQLLIDTFGAGPGVQAWTAALTGEDKYGRALSTSERLEKVGDAYTPGTAGWRERVAAMARRGVNPKVIEAADKGLPVYEVDTKSDLKYASLDFNDRIGDASSILKRALGTVEYDGDGKMKPLSNDDIKSAYAEFLASEKDAFDQLEERVSAAKTLYGAGVRSEVLNIFKDASLRKHYRGPLVDGKYDSLLFKPDFLKEQEKKAIEKDPNNAAAIKQRFNQTKTVLSQFRKDFKSILEE